VLELIDGQQRMTTLTLLLAAVYSVLKQHYDELDDDTRTDVTNLGRQLVSKAEGEPRVTPQIQGHNRDDYRRVLTEAGLKVASTRKPYFPMRRVAKCFNYFHGSISKLAESEGIDPVKAAQRVREAVEQAILVKIEVANHADAFVLFESLNNRGMPLTPVDLIKNHLLAESERKRVMNVDDAFQQWNEMLTNLGDNYATQERFLRHYYNAFKAELPEIPNAAVATRTNLIRIYENLLSANIKPRTEALVAASRIYGRVTCVAETDSPTRLDDSLRQLMRAQGAPSYMLLMWLLSKQSDLKLPEDHLVQMTDQLTSFFVRRNLTGSPQTYALPRLFMTIIEKISGHTGAEILHIVAQELRDASSGDDDFQKRLEGPIYQENADVARFILTTLSEDAMTKETLKDLWAQEKGHFVWTIEHILPQGVNLPDAWKQMLGGAEAAVVAQEKDVHRLGNLTITAYNSTLGNKSFADKRDRTDAKDRFIGYRNGLVLNESLATKNSWTVADIETRTRKLAEQAAAHFPLA
jgi:DNA-binding Lrp family transcriptional regulator